MADIRIKCRDPGKAETRCHAFIDELEGPIKFERPRSLVRYVFFDVRRLSFKMLCLNVIVLSSRAGISKRRGISRVSPSDISPERTADVCCLACSELSRGFSRHTLAERFLWYGDRSECSIKESPDLPAKSPANRKPYTAH